MTQKEIKIFGKTINIFTRNEGDYAIAYELFLDHQYQYCDEVIKKAENAVIDIGGHLGFFSLYTSLLNEKVPIYAFEPHVGNFEMLKKNLKENRVRNVTAKNVAVSGEIGEVELQISQEDLNHSVTGALEPTGETQAVHATTLEHIFKKNRLEKVELIKIDAEGSEFNILYNTPDDIFKKIENMFIEYHDWTPEQNHMELREFLLNKGFKVEKYPNNKIKELGFFWCHR